MLAALDVHADGTYVDATFGGGGYSRAILAAGAGRVIGLDRDPDAVARGRDLAAVEPRFTMLEGRFGRIAELLADIAISEVDGVVFDLGMSSLQLGDPQRGFAFAADGPLDMRMSQDRKQTAADVLNTYSPEALQQVFSRYGELINSRSLAQHLAKAREKKPFKTIGDLLKEAEPFVRGHRPKYLAKLFQALRIEVNEEMEVLGDFLRQSLNLLAPGGRLVVIAYHSVEDRLVKRFLKTGNPEGEVIKDEYGKILRPFKLLSRKPLLPSAEEIRRNPRARSAKMRGGIVLRKNSPEQ